MVLIDTSARTTYLTFLLRSPVLNPREVSNDFGLDATSSEEPSAGVDGGASANGYWALQSDYFVDSRDLRSHFVALLDFLVDKRDVIEKYQCLNYETELGCYWLASSDNTCPEIDSDIVAQLAA
ncbi:MAG: hypothetical protein JSS86_23995, partial [Cyanobacteria bacterium SZAS LIN-2]|nr:hypothetical protein [Cyanobacteria bacterium SZAS LIN-2]